jgi:hypothetical protein
MENACKNKVTGNFPSMDLICPNDLNKTQGNIILKTNIFTNKTNSMQNDKIKNNDTIRTKFESFYSKTSTVQI